MPLTKKGKKIKGAMEETYGKEKEKKSSTPRKTKGKSKARTKKAKAMAIEPKLLGDDEKETKETKKDAKKKGEPEHYRDEEQKVFPTGPDWGADKTAKELEAIRTADAAGEKPPVVEKGTPPVSKKEHAKNDH